MPHPELHLREIDRPFSTTINIHRGEGVVVNNFLGLKVRGSKGVRINRVEFALHTPRDIPIIPDESLEKEYGVYPLLVGDQISTVLRYLKVGQPGQKVFIGKEIGIDFKSVQAEVVAVRISSMSPVLVDRFSPQNALYLEKQVEKLNRFNLDLIQE